MSENNNEFNQNIIEKIYLSFNDGLNSVISKTETDEIDMIFSIIPSIFKKWLYSSLINDTPLTAHNIISSYLKKEILCSFDLKRDGNCAVVIPIIEENTEENPIFIRDLKHLANSCNPVCSVDFSKRDLNLSSFFPDTFIHDNFYISYLALVAEHFGLIEKMPSINTVKYQLNKENYNSFFSKSNIEILKLISFMSIDTFINKAAVYLQAPMKIADRNDILNVLSGSCITDNIFADIYTRIGFDFGNVSSIGEKKHLSEDEEALISSVLYMGILIDKWLLTPLGHYIGLLTPTYSQPYCFKEDYEYIKPVILTGCDLSFELFAPSNCYVLTALGENVFGSSQEDKKIYTLNGNITEADIQETLHAYDIFLSMMNSSVMKKHNTEEVYKVKISFSNDKSLWKLIEVPSEFTLDDFNTEINLYFGITPSKTYSFLFKGTKYSNGKNRFLNSANNTKLSSISLSNGDILYYTNGYDRNLDMKIEFSDIYKAEKTTLYPRLLRQSKEITMKERGDEF